MNISRSISRAVLACMLGGLASQATAQWVQQQIVLRPGWNAVNLDVIPTPADCDTLLAALPIESVWDWNQPPDSAQFVQDPSTLLPGAPGWLTWFPASHPLAAGGSLFALRDGRSYLIKSTNTVSFTWTLQGRPSLRRVTWRTGTVNLVGFHVGTSGPTFQALFAGQTGLVGQPVYSLDANGTWRAISDPATARPKSGEAYWVRCKSPSQATGTILVDAGSSAGLVFGAIATEHGLRIRNASAGARNISVRVLPSSTPPSGQSPTPGPVPLEYWRANYAATNFAWTPLSAPLTFNALAAGQEWNLRLGVRRAAMSAAAVGSVFQSLIEVSDDLGCRWIVPVTAQPGGSSNSQSGFQAASASDVNPLAGVWVGEAAIDAVSQPAHLGNPSNTRPAGGNFSFRLILHVDGAGATRLLRQVFLVRKPAVRVPDSDDPSNQHVETPARTVAVTDEALIPGVIGNAEIVGRRISSPAFSFDQPVALTGGGFGAGTLIGSLNLDYDHRLNPFKHVFHPDHNNLDERFEQRLPEGRESFTVARALSFEFTAADPLGLNPPGWGTTEVGGVYRETISGVHRNSINASGHFRLVRVLAAPELNQ